MKIDRKETLHEMDQVKNIEIYTGHEDMSLVDAIKKINENRKCVLYITDNSGRLIGSLTDGDIRLWIVRTGDLKAIVSRIVNRNVRYIKYGSSIDPYAFMRQENITSVPIVNDNKVIIKIVFISEAEEKHEAAIQNDALFHTPVIIMAGGRGVRLRPYTKILPKPLIPINDVPILERIMNRFHEFGVQDFYLTINYRKEMIKSYFGDTDLPYQIHYVEEDEPLGTAGSIRLIRNKFEMPVIVTNCDTLIQADYGKMLELHKMANNDLSIISANKHMTIPYGVLRADETGKIFSMEEKPEIIYTINTGMYIINPEFLDWIPENRFFHMTDLADMMLKEGRKVGMYPVDEDLFLDMGELEEMKKMEEKIGENFVGED